MSIPEPSEIKKVFYTTPRDGYKKGNLWIKRKEENYLSSLLDEIGTSICIDGPTGTGKSSLAITTLKKKKFNFLLIQVTKNMTWKNFCLKLLNSKVNENNVIDLGPNASHNKEIPLFMTHYGIKPKSKKIENFDHEEKILDRLTDDSICEVLHKNETSIIIDDFERASGEILSNIGEMCKLLTESYVSDKVKIVIVGTDDIYRRLTKFNKALEGRLKELSLGAIDNKNESWNFLLQSFDKLHLIHPALELKKKYKGGITAHDVNECKNACYEAADGLLKSLNELGQEIAKSATINRRVSKSLILQISRNMLERNIRRHNNDYPKLSVAIQRNTIVKDIIIYLFKKGIGRIHNWQDISESFTDGTDETHIENAICELVEIDFITRTGYDGEVLFVTNPTLAHTIGVAICNPNKYKVPKAFVLKNNQYVLPLNKKFNNPH